MKRLLIAAIFLFATSAQADVLNFFWTANTDATEGYRMYMDTGDNVVLDNVSVTQESAELTMAPDGQCHNFWLRAYAGNLESANSDIAIWCPTSVDPPVVIQPVPVGGFTVTVTVEPN